MNYRYLAAALILPLMACSTPIGVQSKVDAAAELLTTAERAYVKLCHDLPKIKVCVNPLKQEIKDADMVAYKAVKAAEKNGALLGTAVEAIASFTDLTTK